VCLLIVEIIMLLGGIVTLFRGKLFLHQDLQLEGWRARVAALFLIAPLPLAFLVGFVLAFLFGADRIRGIATIIEIVIAGGCLGGAFLFAYLSRENP